MGCLPLSYVPPLLTFRSPGCLVSRPCVWVPRCRCSTWSCWTSWTAPARASASCPDRGPAYAPPSGRREVVEGGGVLVQPRIMAPNLPPRQGGPLLEWGGGRRGDPSQRLLFPSPPHIDLHEFDAGPTRGGWGVDHEYHSTPHGYHSTPHEYHSTRPPGRASCAPRAPRRRPHGRTAPSCAPHPTTTGGHSSPLTYSPVESLSPIHSVDATGGWSKNVRLLSWIV